ncbi:protein of unknown function [Pseudodesulfovibrio profundus]|uniref:Uncharacterized protein n=1 Tax=Pseudodesulfovibrio profundus TaxID=57320 RepID=A0A2C8F7G6_9BACT|nr:protein of unknown function [Pseudodesulfovibrio profundus]
MKQLIGTPFPTSPPRRVQQSKKSLFFVGNQIQPPNTALAFPYTSKNYNKLIDYK